MLEPPSSSVPAPPVRASRGTLARPMLLGVIGTVLFSTVLLLLLRAKMDTAMMQRLHFVPLLTLSSVGFGAWLLWRGRFGAGVTCALLGIYSAVTAMALITGIGVHAVALAVYAIVVLTAAAALGRRGLIGFFVLCAGSLVAMYAAEVNGLIEGQEAIRHFPPGTRLGTQLLNLLAAAAIGFVMARYMKVSLAQSREQEQRFSALLHIAADWYWEQDDQYRFTHVSQAAQVPPERGEDLIGRTRWELPGAPHSPVDWDAHRADLAARRPFRDLVMWRSTADGEVRWVSISGAPRFDQRGRFTGYWGVVRDITCEYETQRARAASDRRFRDLFERTPTAVLLHRRGTVLIANEAAAALFGYASPQAMQGMTLTDLNHPDTREFSGARVVQAEGLAVGERLPTAEVRMQRRDGADLFVQAFVTRIELDDGLASMSIYFDVTERRRAEAQLQLSQQMLSGLFEASPDYTAIGDLETGRLHMVNDGFCRLTGYAREEAIGRTTLELGLWDNAEQRAKMVALVRRDGTLSALPIRMRQRDGGLRLCLMSAASFALDGGTYLVTVARDITEIERERLQYRAMLANVSIGIAITRERAFTLANPCFESMFGWAPGALVGQPGRVIWASDAEYEEIGRLAAGTLALGRNLDIEMPVARADGSTFWCRLRGCPVDARDPRHGGSVWIAEDITEQRAFENALANAKEQAEAASRAKSEFLANTSHEIRTPLNGLVGLAQLLASGRSEPAQQQEYLRLMVESAESLSAIISDILDLSKIEAGKLALERADFDLHEMLESLRAAYREVAARADVALTLAIDARVPRRVHGDPLRTRQIVANFLSNALKFTAQGRVSIEALVGAAGVRIEVRDTGPGIAADTQVRLFEPFVQADASTTRRYGGTGLGLSICRQLARLMGGEVGVTSAPGAGSTFWVELPLPAAQAEEPLAPAPVDGAAPLAGQYVLIVEDNPVNLMIAEAFVSGWGAQVLTAANGREAIEAVERAQAAGTPLCAVLMDMHMPVMSGYDAIAELRQRHDAKSLPIIALTAAALTAERDRALGLGANDFVTKPIDAKQLLASLCVYARG